MLEKNILDMFSTEKSVSDIFGIGKISLRYEFLHELLKLKLRRNLLDIFDIGKASLQYGF